MTAEIAIMNMQGVALAADSAVSIGTKKVYNSANKLFALSCFYPIGIMVYGNAQFMGIPWETIIKYYRTNHLKDSNFDLVADFADDFLAFLRTSDLFNGEHEDVYVNSQVSSILTHMRENITKNVTKEIQANGGIDLPGTEKIVKAEVTLRLNILKGLPKNPLFTDSVKQSAKTLHENRIRQFINKIFEKLPISPSDVDAIIDGLIDVFGVQEAIGNSSGIVIAGFGAKEIYPAFKQVDIEGRISGFLKVKDGAKDKISLGNEAVIQPFAQREMVDTFMSGIDPMFYNEVHTALKLILHKIPDSLAKDHGIDIPASKQPAIVGALDDLLGRFRDRLFELQHAMFVSPVLDSVGSLPLDELASMAEALVNLTSFKRRVTMVPESVGGPIDVAVISKGDGFIWIKRKHYFAPELNPHFFKK